MVKITVHDSHTEHANSIISLINSKLIFKHNKLQNKLKL